MTIATKLLFVIALSFGVWANDLLAEATRSTKVRGKVTYPLPGKPLPRFIHSPRPVSKKPNVKRARKMGKKWRSKTCRILVEKYGKNFAELTKYLGPNLKPSSGNASIVASGATPETCDSADKPQSLIQIASAINSNTGKIGIIVPQSGPYGPIGSEIIHGMRRAAFAEGVDFDKQVIVRESFGDPTRTKQILAELVFVHDVSFVVGGLQSPVAEALLPWADKLALPMLLISSKINIPPESKMAFKVFPDQREIAFALAETARLRSFQRVAMIYPTGTGADKIAQLLEEELQKQKISVVKKATYQSTDYNSMENAAKNIFSQHSAGREAEYRNIVWRARRKARRAGIPFSSRMIVLPPRINFDGVFVADNFKNVRHMARIFQYLGVKQIPMFGHHEWRSMALVQPYDEFLEGSFFADFIGSYRDLPKELNVMQTSSPFFVKAEYAQKYDFNLIGFRSFSIASRSVKNNDRRRKIGRFLVNMEDNQSSYFRRGRVFRENRQTFWPAFIFSVQNRGIYLTGQYRESRPRPLAEGNSLETQNVPNEPTKTPKIGVKSAPFPEKIFTH